MSATEVWISLVGMTLLYGVLAVFAGKIFFKTAGKGPAEIEGRRGQALPGNGLLGEPEENHGRHNNTSVRLVRPDLGPFGSGTGPRGFLTGTGMLMKLIGGSREEKRAILHTIVARSGDGNEVWLLVAGGATSPPSRSGTQPFLRLLASPCSRPGRLIVRNVGLEMGQGDTGRLAHRLGMVYRDRQPVAGPCSGRVAGLTSSAACRSNR